MEPSFKYIKNPNKGNKESVAIETKNVGEQNKEAEVIKKKKSKRYGTSVGWGWFQAFNLFVTACFLLICFVFAYFMMSSDSRHEGIPKYVIDQSNDLEKSIFNPQIPADIRESYVYTAPVVRPKVEEQAPPIEFGEIELLSDAQSDTTPDADLPALTLLSTTDGEFEDPYAVGEAENEQNDNFFGDDNFFSAIQLESVLAEDTTTYQPMVGSQNPQVNMLLQQAQDAVNRGQLSEPYTNSALSFYHAALEISPSDYGALTELSRLADHYLKLAEQYYAEGDTFSALGYTDLGLKADPLNPELNQLKSFLINH